MAQGYVGGFPLANNSFVFGFPGEWARFQSEHPKFVEALEPLAKTTEKAMSRVFDDKVPADAVVFFSGSLVHEDFTEVWVLAGNGLGTGALKILRGMYERTVTAAYISKFPEQAKQFWDYSAIAHRKLLNNAKEIYGIDQLNALFGANHILEAEKTYAKVRAHFREILCVKCGIDRDMFSWSKLGMPAMAKKAGFGLEYCYYNAYAWPTQQGHSTVLAISSRLKQQKNGSMFFTRDVEAVHAALASMMSHLLMLKMLRVQDSYFGLGLDAEIKQREAECKAAWPGIENDCGRGL